MSSFEGYALVRLSTLSEIPAILQYASTKKELAIHLLKAETQLVNYILEVQSIALSEICLEDIFTFDLFLSTQPVPFTQQFAYQIARVEHIQSVVKEAPMFKLHYEVDFSINLSLKVQRLHHSYYE